jgi:hypothetical protein
MPRPASILVACVGLASISGACTGLIAGPEVAASASIPVSRDSAYARARRGLSSETFSMDVVDSARGHLTGTRYPSRAAQLGTAASCRVAPDAMSDKAPQVCEQERQQVLARLNETLVPPASP